MDKETLKILQQTELSILEAVAQLCEKHGLRYFLDSGTLIGAIRHNGFIPWDDDVDISMPCQDYFRFLEIAQTELGDGYFIQNFTTEDNFDRSYTKVTKRGTTVIPAEWKYWDVFHGAWIDIFPLFFSDDEKDIRRKRRLYKISRILQAKSLYRSYMLTDGKTTSTVSNYLYASLVGILPLKLRKKIKKKLLDKIFSKENGKYLCRCAIIVRRFDADCFLGEPRYHQFEHLSLRIPNNYDKVLRDEYGDYMKLPPEDKRGSHGEIEVSIGDDVPRSALTVS